MHENVKNIIIFPFWCADEIVRFELVGRHWDKLTNHPADVEICFLFVARWDAPDASHLLEIFSKHGDARLHVCRKPKFNVPGRPTRHRIVKHMFYQAFACVETMYSEFRGFVFWMEHDVMFTNKNWLLSFNISWFNFRNEHGKIVLMGHHVNKGNMPALASAPFLPEHINGVACYTPSILKYIRDTDFMSSHLSFDVFLSNLLVKVGDAKYVNCSNLWEHRLDYHCNPINEMADADPQKMLIHGCKSAKSFKFHFENMLKGGR